MTFFRNLKIKYVNDTGGHHVGGTGSAVRCHLGPLTLSSTPALVLVIGEVSMGTLVNIRVEDAVAGECWRLRGYLQSS